jgi:predicted lipoprotein with Yx(FWY)xxD motif
MRRTVPALVLVLATGPALAQPVEPATLADTAKGKVLADQRGMTLYTFDRDTAGVSSCNGQCAQNWPPLLAPANATASGDWTLVMRGDGGKQWAYKGKPLYGWVRDAKPGDVTGDGVNDVWRAAKP